MHIQTAVGILAETLPDLVHLRDASEAAEYGGEAELAIRTELVKAVGYVAERVDFGGARDRFGRVIGCTITTAQGGGLWLAQAQPTRDGRSYRAGGELVRFDTEAARAAWRTKYLAGAAKRAEARRGK
jgi:hypothetical protein